MRPPSLAHPLREGLWTLHVHRWHRPLRGLPLNAKNLEASYLFRCCGSCGARQGNWIRSCSLRFWVRMGLSMSADRCRQLAADCLRLAQVTNEPSEKALLLEMEESWRLLAAQFEARQKSAQGESQKD